MKFAAVLALAVGAMAHSNNTVVSYTTEVVTAVTTFCPGPTEVTYGVHTYTVTEETGTTLTITDCPCTIKVPVTTISSVICHDCPSYPKPNGTTSIPPSSAAETPAGTITPPSNPPASSTGSGSPPIETAGAGRAAIFSGGALAGVLGLAAFVL